jgi:hypothetical protein
MLFQQVVVNQIQVVAEVVASMMPLKMEVMVVVE